jgi:hypothetical protein
MCRAVSCRTCGLTTWAGCGQHVDAVLRGVPAAQRCPGHAAAGENSARSLISRVFRRR